MIDIDKHVPVKDPDGREIGHVVGYSIPFGCSDGSEVMEVTIELNGIGKKLIEGPNLISHLSVGVARQDMEAVNEQIRKALHDQ